MSEVAETGAKLSVSERRRAEILDAAEFLIALHGYDALRLRDVAHRAEVSIGMIQHYFVTRDDLLRETVRVASAHRVDQWSALGDRAGTPAERLMMLLEGSVTNQHRCVVWVETCAAATRHPDLRDDVLRTHEAWRDTLHEVVAAGVRSGEFSPEESIEVTVSLLVSLIDGLMLSVASQAWSSVDSAVQHLRKAAERLLGI